MATTTASAPDGLSRSLLKPLGPLATAGCLALVGLVISVRLPVVSTPAAIAALAMLAVAVWLLLSERYEWSLVILMLYIGLADGYLKLSTGSEYATLMRDVLLYAIAAGALIRLAVRGQSISWPPLSGWVIAWVIVVAVQVANPGNGTLTHSIGSIRPHVEWVPLFFLGYAVLRSRVRLRALLLLLVVIATVNGIVGFMQLNLTPEQLSAWGPGYEQAISGEGDVSARTYTDAEGETRTRPFGLGGDFGFGGRIGMLAIPAALALLALARGRARVALGLLAIGPVLAVLTSEARVVVVSAAITALAFGALTVTSRGGLRTVLALCVALPITYMMVGLIASNSHDGAFDRYESVSSPSKAVDTALDYRSSTYSQLPSYVTEIPFGDGIGSTGPATSLANGPPSDRNGESQATFLLIELGLPGLLLMAGFFLTLLYVSVTRIRRIADREARILLTAVAAPLFGILATGFVGTNTATTPSSPYIWLAAGIVSFWLLGEGVKQLGGRRWSGA